MASGTVRAGARASKGVPDWLEGGNASSRNSRRLEPKWLRNHLYLYTYTYTYITIPIYQFFCLLSCQSSVQENPAVD